MTAKIDNFYEPGIPLPPTKEHEEFLRDVPDALDAYHVCLELERHATDLAKSEPNSKPKSTDQSNPDDPMICARILGYLLLHAPSQHALAEVVKAIQTHSSSTGPEDSRSSKLLELGACFQNMFIRPCKLLVLLRAVGGLTMISQKIQRKDPLAAIRPFEPPII